MSQTLRAYLLGVCGGFAVLCPAQLFSQTPNRDAKEVLQKVIDAYGGPDKYRSTLNSKVTARARIVSTDMKIEFTMTQYTRADGARRLEKKVLEQKQVSGTDGKDAWLVLPDNSVIDMPPESMKMLRVEQLQQGILLDYEKLGYVIQSGPPQNEGDRTLYPVIFRKQEASDRKPPDDQPGDRFEFYIDGETFLPAKVVLRSPDPWGGESFDLTVVMEKYERSSGVPMPTRVIHRRDGKPFQEVTITAVEIGQQFEDALFRRPHPAD